MRGKRCLLTEGGGKVGFQSPGAKRIRTRKDGASTKHVPGPRVVGNLHFDRDRQNRTSSEIVEEGEPRRYDVTEPQPTGLLPCGGKSTGDGRYPLKKGRKGGGGRPYGYVPAGVGGCNLLEERQEPRLSAELYVKKGLTVEK